MNTNDTNPANKRVLTQRMVVASVIAACAVFAFSFVPNVFSQTDKAAASLMPRYQVSAWAVTGERGCYIIDTSTGELWVSHVSILAGAPQKIGEKLK